MLQEAFEEVPNVINLLQKVKITEITMNTNTNPQEAAMSQKSKLSNQGQQGLYQSKSF